MAVDLKSFLLRAWKPCLSALLITSAMLAVSFCAMTGSFLSILSTVGAIFIVAAPVIVVLGLPLSFLAWRFQQQRRIKISQTQAGLAGALVGFLSHTLLLLVLGAWSAFPQALLLTLLVGGSYGLVFGVLLYRMGGLQLLPRSER